jgi:hypothetical protein
MCPLRPLPGTQLTSLAKSRDTIAGVSKRPGKEGKDTRMCSISLPGVSICLLCKAPMEAPTNRGAPLPHSHWTPCFFILPFFLVHRRAKHACHYILPGMRCASKSERRSVFALLRFKPGCPAKLMPRQRSEVKNRKKIQQPNALL